MNDTNLFIEGCSEGEKSMCFQLYANNLKTVRVFHGFLNLYLVSEEIGSPQNSTMKRDSQKQWKHPHHSLLDWK